MRERHRGLAAGRTREFVVGDGGGKKNLARRGTSEFTHPNDRRRPVQTRCRTAKTTIRISKESSLPESMENLDAEYMRVASNPDEASYA